MSESAIRAKIKTTLQGVSGIGAVHDYDRYSRSLAEFFKLMSGGSPAKINGWMIHRGKTPAQRDNAATIQRAHTFTITGIYELDDENASEKTFQALLEAIFEAFKSDITLGGTALNSDPLSIDDVDVDEYGNRLFHVAELTLVVYDRATY